MKKLLFVLIFIVANSISYAQNIIIQQSNDATKQSATHDSNEYFINGISTREDIGGVDVEFVEKKGSASHCYLMFKNHRNVPVTVLFEITELLTQLQKTTGSITLRAYETKSTPNTYSTYHYRNCVMIVRKL